MEEILSWITAYLQDEGKTGLQADLPLFGQIDSFSVVGFLLALEERFNCFEQISAQALSGLTIEQIASLLASRQS